MNVEQRSAVGTRRLFFTLWPSDAVRDRIVNVAQPHLAGGKARLVRLSNLHLTLAFLGSIAEDAVAAAIDAGDAVRAAPFELALDRMETWRAARIACLTVDPVPVALESLVTQLRRNVQARGLPVDQKDFRAHVTLARDWRGAALDCQIEPMRWPVSEFMLAESPAAGGLADYRIVRTWSLSTA